MSPFSMASIKRKLKHFFLYLKTFWKIPLGLLVCTALVWVLKIAPFLFMDFTPPPTYIQAQSPSLVQWDESISALGTLEATHSVVIAPEVEGKITEIFFEEGQWVEEGAPILQLNDKSQQADLEKSQALLEYAKMSMSRSQTLAKERFESQDSFEQKRATERQTRAQLSEAQAMIEKKKVQAPFSGKLGIRQVNVGQYLQAGTPIVTLINPKMLFVTFTLPEQEASRVRIGQEVMVRVNAFPDRLFHARVSVIEPQVDIATRTLKIKASFSNPDLLLVPGMFAELSVVIQKNPPQWAIPETALEISTEGLCVFVADSQHSDASPQEEKKFIVKKIPVEIGQRREGKVILRKGITGKERIILVGQNKLREGIPVQISETEALVIPSSPSPY